MNKIESINVPEFKIRASGIGQIMGALKGGITEKQAEMIETLENKVTPLTKLQTEKLNDLIVKRDTPLELNETAKAHCKNWVKMNLYGRRKIFSSKQTDKGIQQEDLSIRTLNDYLKKDYKKNEESFENDYITGTPDIITDTQIRDIKSSWDCYTFPLFFKGLPTKDYEWQVLGYMDLTGKKETGSVDYVLVDTPDDIIDKEFRFNNPDELEYDEFKKDFIYSHIKPSLRIKSFPIEYNEEKIRQIHDRVKMCREYIKNEILW